MANSSPSSQAEPVRRRVLAATLLLAGAFYALATIKVATSKEPFIDEGWLASPAYNLAFHGSMGTTVLEPTGSWLNAELKGIQEYTYWVMPLDLLAQAAWYRLVGFGIVQMRILSAFWGALVLFAWFQIVNQIAKSRLAATITVLLLSCDFTFIWLAADGRMDMMCLALGSLGLAAYLRFRETRLRTALLLANALIAASILTHPNGVVWFCILLGFVLTKDRRRLGWASVVYATLPYVAFATAWGIYIAQRPDYFMAQMAANSSGPTRRGLLLLHPLVAIERELLRYLGHFGGGPVWAAPVPEFAIFVPLIYGAVSLIAAAKVAMSGNRRLGTFLAMLGVCVGLMTFGDGLKAENYIGIVLPFYAAVFAVLIVYTPRNRVFPLLVFAAALVVCQLAVLREKLTDAPLKDYQRVIAFLKSNGGSSVTGDSVLGFGLGYRNLIDDARLGELSGKQSDLVVVDRWYAWDWEKIFPRFDPLAAQYVQRSLLQHYVPVYRAGAYRIYKRQGYRVLQAFPPNLPQK